MLCTEVSTESMSVPSETERSTALAAQRDSRLSRKTATEAEILPPPKASTAEQSRVPGRHYEEE